MYANYAEHTYPSFLQIIYNLQPNESASETINQMKKILSLVLTLILVKIAICQNISGTVITRVINSIYLKNTGGDHPDRRISVYLPPGYDHSQQRYPVIYYLHGFMGTDSITPGMKNILDLALSKNKIRPYIFVIADNNTLFSGSFYSDST